MRCVKFVNDKVVQCVLTFCVRTSGDGELSRAVTTCEAGLPYICEMSRVVCRSALVCDFVR